MTTASTSKGEGGKYHPTRQGLAVPQERVEAFVAMCNEYAQETATGAQ